MQRTQGFTLVECALVCAVTAVLAAVALPQMQHHSLRAARLDAVHALTRLQTVQEQHRSAHGLYASELAALRGVAAVSDQGRYTLALAAAPASAPLNGAYTATATAQNAQADDTRCKLLGVMVKGGDLTFASGTSSVDFAASAPDANRCWAR